MPMWCPIADCAPWETMNSSPLQPCAMKAASIAALISSEASGAPPRRSSAAALIPASAADCACRIPASSAAVFAAATEVEQLALGVELDPLCPEPVGDLHREHRGDGRPGHAERRARARGDLEQRRLAGQAGADQLVAAELLERVDLHAAELLEARDLERADHDVAVAVALDVEERVADPDRQLVAQLRRALRRVPDEDVRHRDGIVIRIRTVRPCRCSAPTKSRRSGSSSPGSSATSSSCSCNGPEQTPLAGAGDIDFGAKAEAMLEALAGLGERVSAARDRRAGARRRALSRDLRARRRGGHADPLLRAPVGTRGRVDRGRRAGGGPRRVEPRARDARAARLSRAGCHARGVRHPDLPALPAGRAAGVPAALASPRVRAAAIESTEFPLLAEEHGVYAVPAIVIDGEHRYAGAVPERLFVERLLAAVG